MILFFVSWAPFHFQRLSYVYFKELEMFRTVNQILFYASGCFYYLSSTLNPLLYNVMSIKYRQAFRAAMTCRRLKEEQNPVVKFTTFNTSTTNLITSSYLHLKDLLDSRRSSRNSELGQQGLLAAPAWRGREVRSNSLGPTTTTSTTAFTSTSPTSNLLTVPGLGPRKTNLSRQISLSDSGEAIFPRFSPDPAAPAVLMIIEADNCRSPANNPPGPRHIGCLKSLNITYNVIPSSLIEEKEETSTNL